MPVAWCPVGGVYRLLSLPAAPPPLALVNSDAGQQFHSGTFQRTGSNANKKELLWSQAQTRKFGFFGHRR